MDLRRVAGVIVAIAVAACGSEPGPEAGPAGPSGSLGARPSATPIIAPIVLPIDPGYEAVEGASRGAYALRLEGDFGTHEFHGNGSCFWDEANGPATADGFTIPELGAFGEQLEVIVFDSIVIHRSIGGRQFASYQAAAGADVRDVSPGGDLRILAFRDLAQDPTEEPEGEAPFPDFHRPLGGLAGAGRLSGVLAWQCEPPAPQPTPYQMPTAKCPAPAQAPEPPAVSASIGSGAPVLATLGSYTMSTCSTTGTADAVPDPPEEPLLAHPGDGVRFTVAEAWRFLRWEGFDTAVVGEGGNVWEPTDLPDGPRSIDVPVPARPNDSILGLTVVLASDDDRVILQLSFEVLVRVS